MVQTRMAHVTGAVVLIASALGLCLVGCGKRRDLECERTCSCEQLGRCTQDGNRCVVDDDEDCQRSRRCKFLGACTAVDGECRVKSSADCAQAQTCKVGKNCTFRDGSCKK